MSRDISLGSARRKEKGQVENHLPFHAGAGCRMLLGSRGSRGSRGFGSRSSRSGVVSRGSRSSRSGRLSSRGRRGRRSLFLLGAGGKTDRRRKKKHEEQGKVLTHWGSLLSREFIRPPDNL